MYEKKKREETMYSVVIWFTLTELSFLIATKSGVHKTILV